MPLPKPGPEEDRDQFIARCMANPTMREDFSNVGQRAAVCFDLWREDHEEEEYANPRGNNGST